MDVHEGEGLGIILGEQMMLACVSRVEDSRRDGGITHARRDVRSERISATFISFLSCPEEKELTNYSSGKMVT